MTADAKGQTDVSVIYRSILASLKELRPEMSVVERFALTVTLSANAARDMRAAFGVAPDLVKALEEAKAENVKLRERLADWSKCTCGEPRVPTKHDPSTVHKSWCNRAPDNAALSQKDPINER